MQMGSIFSLIEGQRIRLIEEAAPNADHLRRGYHGAGAVRHGFAVAILRQLKKLQAADVLISTINQELQRNNQHLSQLNQ
ncbi:MAG: hypothetical protein WKG07_05705 [Hymenobacter sp.]